MKLPPKPGEYLFYYEKDGECWYKIEEVCLAFDGRPYLPDWHASEPTYWWNLPKPGDGFKESEVGNERH